MKSVSHTHTHTHTYVFESAQFSHSISVEGTVKIVRSIKGEEEFSVEFSVLAHKAMIAETQARLRIIRGCKIRGNWI